MRTTIRVKTPTKLGVEKNMFAVVDSSMFKGWVTHNTLKDNILAMQEWDFRNPLTSVSPMTKSKSIKFEFKLRIRRKSIVSTSKQRRGLLLAITRSPLHFFQLLCPQRSLRNRLAVLREEHPLDPGRHGECRFPQLCGSGGEFHGECGVGINERAREISPFLACLAARSLSHSVVPSLSNRTLFLFPFSFGFQERCEITVSMLLTSVAFKLVIADKVPKVAYDTMLDVYLFKSLQMLFAIILLQATIGLVSRLSAAGVVLDSDSSSDLIG